MPELPLNKDFRHSFHMDDRKDPLIEAIQSSGWKACIVVAGGGSGAVHRLLAHSGASRFVMEAQIPYSARAMFDYLGESLDSFCSEAAAETMAGRAFERALVFSLSSNNGSPILGIACSAALQTTRDRKGADRAHIHIKARKHQLARTVELHSGSRSDQEKEVDDQLLQAIRDFLEGVT